MEKIVVETKMQKIPEKCTDCKFSYTKVSNCESIRFCGVSNNRQMEKVYVEERKNWTYLVPEWCPLAIYDVTEE